MKRSLFILFMAFYIGANAQHYIPTKENLAARETFRNDAFGLFIHWGIFSIPGDGEWVMNDRGITVKNYKRLMNFFYPMHFNAAEWVSMAKNAGMKYITLITRHHDGFSMWNTKYSDYNIMHTPYGKDAVKMIADECHKQGIQLFLYYSLLDWSREDYPHETGRTGQHSGRTGHGDYAHYLQFMKNQLTELLTHYGKIAGIWFDGHWDQTAPEGATDRSSRIDWHYDEIYGLIHKLQPQCLIGNNHHLTPFDGEDFQMFEKDLPGQNNTGLSFQKPSHQLPLETCETMNNSWGYNIGDTNYKSVTTLLHYLINDAGRNANFLLNVGPMPDGKIQPEFVDTLKAIGKWMKENGTTIYNTRGNIIPPQKWGVITANKKTFYVHITEKPESDTILLPGFTQKIINAFQFKSANKIPFTITGEGTILHLESIRWKKYDTIIKLEIQ